MYKSIKQGIQRIVSELTTITPLEKPSFPIHPNPPETQMDEDTPHEIVHEIYHELPLNYAKRDDNDSPDIDNVYSYEYSRNYKFREFYYLHDELSKQYDCRGTKTVMLCIFAFNDSCFYLGEPYPFLQFLAQNKDNKYTFPSFVFDCPSNLDDEQLQTHFANNCLKHVLDFFVIEGGNLHTYATENMTRSYRGFIENGNTIYAVYDMSNFMKMPMRSSNPSEWCVLNELTDANLTHEYVVEFFDKYKYMSTIQSVMSIPRPIVLYLYDITKREAMSKNIPKSLLEPRSSHPLYGNFYYFVDKRHPGTYRKCAVFVENMVDTTTMNEANNLTNLSNTLEITESNDTAKNVDNIDEDLNGIDVAHDSYLEELIENTEFDDMEDSENSEEPTEEPAEEPAEHSAIYDLPFTSIIAFNEKNAKIWCIKTESIFTEL